MNQRDKRCENCHSTNGEICKCEDGTRKFVCKDCGHKTNLDELAQEPVKEDSMKNNTPPKQEEASSSPQLSLGNGNTFNAPVNVNMTQIVGNGQGFLGQHYGSLPNIGSVQGAGAGKQQPTARGGELLKESISTHGECFDNQVQQSVEKLKKHIAEDKKTKTKILVKNIILTVLIIILVLSIVLAATLLQCCNDKPTDNPPTSETSPSENSGAADSTDDGEEIVAGIKYAIYTIETEDGEKKYAVVTGFDEGLDGEVAIDAEYKDESVDEPVSVIEIAKDAFRGNANLTSVKIPTSVIKIGDYAFASCVNLSRILIPDTVVAIGEQAFYGCVEMKVDYQGTMQDWTMIGIAENNDDLQGSKHYFNSVDIHCSHEFESRVPNDKYKVSEATCNSRASYYLSCVCGATHLDVFSEGELQPHQFVEQPQNAYLKESFAVAKIYYLSCACCGATSEKTFEISVDSTIHISTAKDLYNCLSTSKIGASYILDDDIDCTGLEWLPIENFEGELNGNGKTIKNLRIRDVGNLNKSTVYTGFVQINNGIIKNLNFDTVTIEVDYRYDSSVTTRLCGGLVGVNNGSISSVKVINSKFDLAINESQSKSGHDANPILDLGAIAGWNYGKIEYCKVERTTLKGYSNAAANYGQTYSVVGGLVGTNKASILNSISTSLNISSEAKGGYYKFLIGGGWVKNWVGYVTGNNEGRVQKCVSYGHVALSSKTTKLGSYMGVQNYRGLAFGNNSGASDKVFVVPMQDVTTYVGNNKNLYKDRIQDKELISDIVELWSGWSFENGEFNCKSSEQTNPEIQAGKTNSLTKMFPEEETVKDGYDGGYLYGAGCLANDAMLKFDISSLDFRYMEYKQQNSIKIVIELDIKESDDGYQEVYLYQQGVSAKNVQGGIEKALADWEVAHTSGKKDGNYARYRLTAVVNREDISSLEELWIAFDARGNDADTWNYKNVSISIEASTEGLSQRQEKI